MLRLTRAVSTLVFSAALAYGATGYRVLTHYPIAGSGGWDYITVDSQARRLYVSHEDRVEVLDADTGKSVGVIPDTPGVHGIAIANAFKHGFTTNGKDNTVSMFDPATLKLIRKIPVGKGPDAIYFDPGSKRVFTTNHGSDDISAIDAASGEVVGTVAVGGGGEQMVSGRDALLYVNIEDTSEVLVLDPKTMVIRHRFPIGVAKTPTGLALDPKTNRLFIGCRSKSLVVMSATDGKVITSLPLRAGVDAAYFDADNNLIFASTGDGVLSIYHEKSADQYENAGDVPTQPSARTMAFDVKTKKLFLPAAQVETKNASEPGARPNRKIKEGTFGVLVVGK